MHQQGRMSEETISFLVGSVSVNLKSKFTIDENGLWYSKRLEMETKKRNEFTESRRMNGKQGGRPKNSKPYAKASANHMGNHMGNENDNDIINNNSKVYGIKATHFILIKGKYANESTARVNGKDGLTEYMEANQTILNMAEYADKFMRYANGKIYNDIGHLQNAYSLYIEKQFK